MASQPKIRTNDAELQRLRYGRVRVGATHLEKMLAQAMLFHGPNIWTPEDYRMLALLCRQAMEEERACGT